jgi:RES domain-containing protein
MSCLYLGLTIEGAVLEASQGFAGKIQPLTICMYEIDCDNIVDLTDETARATQNVSLEDLSCAWALDLANGREPASWRISRRFIQDGAAGLLVPSFAVNARPDMKNAVLWKWGADLPCKVEVHDPSGRLPRDQLSWN